MPFDEKPAERVRRILSIRNDIVERKMMGGLCFMAGENMCCGVTRSMLLVRVGPKAYEAVLAQRNVRPLEFGPRQPKGFVLVDPAGFRTEAALERWVQRSLDFVATIPRKIGARKARAIKP